MSSTRSWSRRISAARDFKVGFLMVATLLICFLAILYSIHADEIPSQNQSGPSGFFRHEILNLGK
jgi:hypothetical protein